MAYQNHDWRSELRALGRWVLGLATLGGFLFGAWTTGLEWLTIPGLLVAALVAFRRRIAYGVEALRHYGAVCAANDELLSQAERLRADLPAKLAQTYETGRKEGQLEVGGIIAAGFMNQPPPLRGIRVVEGEALLIADLAPVADDVVDGARFSLWDGAAGEHKGLVVIGLVDEDSQSIHLHCVQELVPEFWEGLGKAAVVDSRPPPNLELTEIPDYLLPHVDPRNATRVRNEADG